MLRDICKARACAVCHVPPSDRMEILCIQIDPDFMDSDSGEDIHSSSSSEPDQEDKSPDSQAEKKSSSG